MKNCGKVAMLLIIAVAVVFLGRKLFQKKAAKIESPGEAGGTVPAGQAAGEAEGGSVGKAKEKELVLEVPTITCWACEPRVEQSVKGVPGVTDVKFDGAIVSVKYSPSKGASKEKIIEAIEQGGDRVERVIKPGEG